jgi:hypothetical protein
MSGSSRGHEVVVEVVSAEQEPASVASRLELAKLHQVVHTIPARREILSGAGRVQPRTSARGNVQPCREPGGKQLGQGIECSSSNESTSARARVALSAIVAFVDLREP